MADKEVFDPSDIDPKEVWDFDGGLEFIETESTMKIAWHHAKMEEIKRKIEPFLDNLSRNPEKDIHWPDRDKRIAKFKQELWDIIDGK